MNDHCKHCDRAINAPNDKWVCFGNAVFCSNECLHSHFEGADYPVSLTKEQFLNNPIEHCDRCRSETLHPIINRGRFFCSPECLNAESAPIPVRVVAPIELDPNIWGETAVILDKHMDLHGDNDRDWLRL